MRNWLLAAGLLPALALGNACSDSASLPSSGSSTGESWQRVTIFVPPESFDEFPEGAGLIRRLAPEEASGANDAWLGYFPASEIARLRARGFEIQSDAEGLLGLEAQNGSACKDPGVSVERFCPYDTSTSAYSVCNRSIFAELGAATTDYPPLGGGIGAYVETVDYGTSYEGRTLRGVRVGRIWRPGDARVPQFVVYGAQHAREWIGPEMLMRLYRYFASSYRDDTHGVRALLANAAILFVPVANPDGYGFTHSGANRIWRKNRQPCAGSIGTDPNRNFEYGWGLPGAGTTCDSDTYRGDAPGSASETLPFERLLAHQDLPGQYVTRFSLNMHSYGNLMLFPEGLSTGFSPCGTEGNCTAPDLAAFLELVGTELTTPMADEETGRSYLHGQTYRNLYAVSGDTPTSAEYGMASIPKYQGALSALIEITHTECGFRGEGIPVAQQNQLFEHLRQLHERIALQLPALDSGSFYAPFALPHLHRRQVGGVGNEFPTIRLSARKEYPSVALIAPGTSERDDVQDGVGYAMWRFRSDNPYVFPVKIPVCAKGANCRTLGLPDPGTGNIDLCSPGLFPSADPGWSFVPDAAGGPREECYWRNAGAVAGSLTSSHWSLASMVRANLVYSHRGQSRMRVLISNNGFVGCSYATGTGCRIVREHPYGDSNYDLRNGDYRTDIIDVSDFDHQGDVQLRFEVAPGSEPFDVFDPIIIGWLG